MHTQQKTLDDIVKGSKWLDMYSTFTTVNQYEYKQPKVYIFHVNTLDNILYYDCI